MISKNPLSELTEKLKLVVRGYHPATKLSLPETSDLKDPDIVELHMQILAELLNIPATLKDTDYTSIMQQRKNERLGKPINHNAKWETRDLEQLSQLFLKGTQVLELSELFGRTIGSIVSRLKLESLISVEEGDRLYRQADKASKNN